MPEAEHEGGNEERRSGVWFHESCVAKCDATLAAGCFFLFLLVERGVMFRFGGIVSWIGSGKLCADFFLPGVQPFPELVRFGGHLRGKVMLLTDVLAQIIKFDARIIEEFDQFELAFANGGIWRGAPELVMLIMRVMPE